MSSSSTIDLLNRLLVIHHRSLAVYLSYAVPWISHTRVEAGRTLALIAEHHKAMTDRLSTAVLDNGGLIENGYFPMSFTGLHDVSLDYLLKILWERQQKEVRVIETIVDALRLTPQVQALALEALGESKAHLDMLQDIQVQTASH